MEMAVGEYYDEPMIVWKYRMYCKKKKYIQKEWHKATKYFLKLFFHDIVIWTQDHFETRELIGLWGPLWGSEVEVKCF